MKKIPIGIQNFKELITKGFYYVDKTEFIYKLIQINTISLHVPEDLGNHGHYLPNKFNIFKNLFSILIDF